MRYRDIASGLGTSQKIFSFFAGRGGGMGSWGAMHRDFGPKGPKRFKSCSKATKPQKNLKPNPFNPNTLKPYLKPKALM